VLYLTRFEKYIGLLRPTFKEQFAHKKLFWRRPESTVTIYSVTFGSV